MNALALWCDRGMIALPALTYLIPGSRWIESLGLFLVVPFCVGVLLASSATTRQQAQGRDISDPNS